MTWFGFIGQKTYAISWMVGVVALAITATVYVIVGRR